MTTIPKPRPIAFMTAGYDLADALAILDRWETLSDEEVAALGLFGAIQGSSDPGDSAHEAIILRPNFKGRRDPL